MTGGAELLSGEELSGRSEQEKKKKKMQNKKQPRSGCQLGAHLIEYATPLKWSVQLEQRRGGSGGASAAGGQPRQTKRQIKE